MTWVSRLVERREHLLLAAIVSLSWGSLLSLGMFSVTALVDVLLAGGCMGLAIRARGSTAGSVGWSSAVALTAAGALHYASYLSLDVEIPLAVLLAVAVTAAAAVNRRGLSVAFACVGMAALVSMIAVPWHWGVADIDVFSALQNASAAVLHGQNPYATTTPTLLVPGANPVYVTANFGYLPGSALLAAPARLAGDVRLMSIVAVAATVVFGWCVALRSPGGTGRAVKLLAVSLALPATVAMIHWAWIDVYITAGLAGWIALRRAHPRWALVCLTLALTIKPTTLVVLVPAWLWSRPARREIYVSVALAAVVILPFVLLTGAGAFYQDVLGIQVLEGFRADSITLSALSYQLTGHLIPVVVSVVAGVGVAYIAVRRRPRDTADMLTQAALLSTASFLLAQKAFLNYYFVPLWLLVLALASQDMPLDRAADLCSPALVRRVVPSRIIARLLPGAERVPEPGS